VELIVLGTSGAYPGPGRAASGYLVRHAGFTVAIDLGSGAFANLQRHVGHPDVDALLISHEHVDHCVDLYALWMARYFHPGELPPMPLFAPAGVFDRVARLHDDRENVLDMGRRFDVREVEPGSSFEVGPFRVGTRLMPHWVPNAGMRLEADGAVLAYTGDTGPSEEIETIGRDADLLVTEASWLDGQDTRPFHITARQAGEHAERARARRLMLSHFWPTNEREPYRQQAGEAYHGDLILAEEGMALQVAG
jgi:ribonuclease BN (tRNA processing enzyme)